MQFMIWLALLPSFVIATMIYIADKKEKEPLGELMKAFLMGICSVILTLVISFIFKIDKFYIDTDNLIKIAFYSFICVSLVEELTKWICTKIFLKNNKNFDYLFDGIVYATFVSLGFATIENILYFLDGDIITSIVRAITTVPAHAFFGIYSGYYISLSKMSKIKNLKKSYIRYLFLSLIIPVLLHGFYDFCLLAKSYLFYVIYLIFIVYLYSFSIYHVKKMMNMEEAFIKLKKSK